MSRIDEVKEFANMTKQIYQDLIEIGSKKLKDIGEVVKDDDFIESKEYEREDAAKYLEQSSKLKEEINPEGKTPSIEKKDISNEKAFIDVNLREENLMQAVIYSEIFGKPKAKRRRRW